MMYHIEYGNVRCGVIVENDVIVDTAPILKKFRGQSLSNLSRWLKGINGHMETMD